MRRKRRTRRRNEQAREMPAHGQAEESGRTILDWSCQSVRTRMPLRGVDSSMYIHVILLVTQGLDDDS